MASVDLGQSGAPTVKNLQLFIPSAYVSVSNAAHTSLCTFDFGELSLSCRHYRRAILTVSITVFYIYVARLDILLV